MLSSVQFAHAKNSIVDNCPQLKQRLRVRPRSAKGVARWRPEPTAQKPYSFLNPNQIKTRILDIIIVIEKEKSIQINKI